MNDPKAISATLHKIKVMQSFCDGAEIEFRRDETDSWSVATNPNWMWSEYEYRVKPTPKLRAWTIDEVPLDAWYRQKADTCNLMRLDAIHLDTCRVKICGTSWNMTELHNHFQHSLDQGKTWRACGKEEV